MVTREKGVVSRERLSSLDNWVRSIGTVSSRYAMGTLCGFSAFSRVTFDTMPPLLRSGRSFLLYNAQSTTDKLAHTQSDFSSRETELSGILTKLDSARNFRSITDLLTSQIMTF